MHIGFSKSSAVYLRLILLNGDFISWHSPVPPASAFFAFHSQLTPLQHIRRPYNGRENARCSVLLYLSKSLYLRKQGNPRIPPLAVCSIPQQWHQEETSARKIRIVLTSMAFLRRMGTLEISLRHSPTSSEYEPPEPCHSFCPRLQADVCTGRSRDYHRNKSRSNGT